MPDNPLTALVVVAEEAKRLALHQLLTKAGFKIRSASNGADAIRLAKEIPDIIILDLHLPDLSGFEVCTQIKAQAATAVIPVLHLSDGPVECGDFDHHLERGVEAHLIHPVEAGDFLASVMALLRGRQLKRQFNAFLEVAPDAVVIVDHTGKMVQVNGQAEKTFHYGREELIGQDVELLMPERFRERHKAQIAGFVAQPITRPMGPGLKLWGLRKGGSEFPVEISLSPILDQDSVLIASIIRDVTERSRTEAALHISEIRYRRLFETAKDGILILDTESGKITDANPFMSELLGYSHESFLGKELWEIGLFSDKVANEAAVRTLQDLGYIRYEHLPLETSRGQLVEVEVVANAYQEDDHKVIQCNIRDITERSRLEKQMQEQAVALKDLHRRKDEFLAMLSHELRNPLAPITNAVRLLSFQKHEDDLKHQARTIIERQVGQLTRLIDDLLEVSRITTGRIHLQKERIGLNGIVERAVETARPLLDRHKHALIIALSPQPIWLQADAARIEQVVVNLLTNAAKYTTDGGHITIAVKREGDQAVLRVRDTGVGIAPELLPHIFDLFTQAERSLDRSQGGLGIGLSLVQRLVEMHDGKVEVESEVGKGSDFVVRLPVMATPTTQSASPQPRALSRTGPSLRVLVVDDNVDTAQTLRMLLKTTGHDVFTAYDGPTALKAVLDFRPNVVLLDIGLPGLDGFEVAKRLREDPSLNDVVLIAMTGYGQAEDLQRSKEAGFNHHLVKPADFEKVCKILATVSKQAN
ncbi:Autoinducer 2 sensor kinase/phosphatase LuxQ [Anatilimnocola aggregata]|uniref:histidine kinase n=1 Tax=Anatilimnocola aggregata TaxID=2528021 RepID=A0A517YCW3_9BACT|nr:PAS domain S-box protein [Anatilimnocola aggregata]QDU28071.1 Autoinducer 2 sensor kinase/phosphatase LuxQ [Anatilimnocola aggregata]